MSVALSSRIVELSGVELNEFPTLLGALAAVKEAAALANRDLGLLTPEIAGAIVEAAREIQRERFRRAHIQCNAEMSSRHMRKYCELDVPSRRLLDASPQP